MKRGLVAALLVAALAVPRATRAESHDFDPTGIYVLLGLALLADGALSAHDLVVYGNGERSGRGYAAIELAVTLPQVVFLGEALADPSTEVNGVLITLTAWTGLLSAHAIYTLIAGPLVRPPVTVAPAVVSGGAGVSVGFTW